MSDRPRFQAPLPPPASSTRKTSLRVRLAGKLTAHAAPGGGETQLAATARALRNADTDARLWRPWEDDFRQFDVLHLFGSEPEHLPLVAVAHARRVPVALSPIAWFDWRTPWFEGRSWAVSAWQSGKFIARAACPIIPSWRKRLYTQADLLLPNSQAEAEQLQRYFRVPSKRIRVVPNGASPNFALADAESFSRFTGLRDFVLCAGRLEPRKNQLRLLRALHGMERPLVLLGDPVPGHENYAQACRRAADPRVTFLNRIEHDDPLLAGAYAACRCLVVPSWFETPGLVALEAAMSGTPLVLTERGSAAEYFGAHAQYINPADAHAMYRAVREACDRPRSTELAALVQGQFTWDCVAQATREAYDEIL